MKSEAAITKAIIRYCRLEGHWCYKTWGSGYARAGVPDILVCANGKFVAFEVKNEAGKVSKLQEFEIKNIEQAGGVAAVVRNLDDAVEILSEP